MLSRAICEEVPIASNTQASSNTTSYFAYAIKILSIIEKRKAIKKNIESPVIYSIPRYLRVNKNQFNILASLNIQKILLNSKRA
jgi:hypothetical protein